MPDIEKEIEEMAENMSKSTQTSQEKLFEVIKSLGPEGLKEKLLAKSEDGTPLLSDEDRIVVRDALAEMNKMKKAVSMDDAYQATYVQGNINDTKIQEDKADDDQDEKLVKPEAANHNHQGDNSPEAIQGQVIKSIEELQDLEKGLFPKDMKEDSPIKGWEPETKSGMRSKITGLLRDLDRLRSDKWLIHQDETPEAKAIFEKEYDRIRAEIKACSKKYDKLKKSKEAAMAKEAVKDIAEKEAKEEVDDHNKKLHGKDKKKDAGMKKSVIEVNGKEVDLDEVKKSAIEVLKSEGVEEPSDDLVKAKMKKLLAEEDQNGDAPEMDEKTRAKKEKMPDQVDVDDANKQAQDKVDDLNQGKMKKSVPWADSNHLITSGRGGQNMHFSMNGFVDDMLAKGKEEEEQDLKKSEVVKEMKDMDTNDLIEKGLTKSWKDIETEMAHNENSEAQNGELVKSFQDNEIAAALGLSEEEAKKILGE